jgi:hypothetical protein
MHYRTRCGFGQHDEQRNPRMSSSADKLGIYFLVSHQLFKRFSLRNGECRVGRST